MIGKFEEALLIEKMKKIGKKYRFGFSVKCHSEGKEKPFFLTQRNLVKSSLNPP